MVDSVKQGFAKILVTDEGGKLRVGTGVIRMPPGGDRTQIGQNGLLTVGGVSDSLYLFGAESSRGQLAAHEHGQLGGRVGDLLQLHRAGRDMLPIPVMIVAGQDYFLITLPGGQVIPARIEQPVGGSPEVLAHAVQKRLFYREKQLHGQIGQKERRRLFKAIDHRIAISGPDADAAVEAAQELLAAAVGD